MPQGLIWSCGGSRRLGAETEEVPSDGSSCCGREGRLELFEISWSQRNGDVGLGGWTIALLLGSRLSTADIYETRSI